MGGKQTPTTFGLFFGHTSWFLLNKTEIKVPSPPEKRTNHPFICLITFQAPPIFWEHCFSPLHPLKNQPTNHSTGNDDGLRGGLLMPIPCLGPGNRQAFFEDTKWSLWWLPEVNNMCRVRALGSRAAGEKMGVSWLLRRVGCDGLGGIPTITRWAGPPLGSPRKLVNG